MVGYIYKITNCITGQSYIGQTIDIKRRKRKHYQMLENNTHVNPKLQASWNKYGKENFDFTFWEFNLNSADELDQLECEYIEKYNGLTEGFNLIPGGSKPPNHQKVKDDDLVTFLCVQSYLGDGYGKTCEQIFGWSKGTASSVKLKKRFLNANLIFEKLSSEERIQRATDFIESQHLIETALERQLTQGGCKQAYSLKQDDYNFAFCAQEMGYKASVVAKYFGVKESTVYDWFNQRSRKKERQIYNNLTLEEKSRLVSRVKTAELNGKPKSISSI